MESVRGVTLHPWSLFTVKSTKDFQIFYPHKIEIAYTKMKLCNQIKIRVLNASMGSEISYDAN